MMARGTEDVEAPKPDESWHPVALCWYLSLGASAQSRTYEPSDWMTAYLVAESISRELQPQPVVSKDGVAMLTIPPRAAALTAWLKAMAALLATEGDRLRARLVLERPEPSPDNELASVAHLDDLRRRLVEP